VLPRKGASATYFAALGFGFMFFEITLIQRLVLFLGYPTYSLTVTLASILVFTGVGALLSARFADRTRAMTGRLFVAVLSLVAFYLFGLPRITDALIGWPLAARVVVTFVVLAPLGVCLGMFMPLGIGVVARLSMFPREYVAWAWAVNGFASVVGAVLTTILAMTFGFNAVLVLALVVYAVALAVLRSLAAPRSSAELVSEEPPAVAQLGAKV
jgi:MFS family permease